MWTLPLLILAIAIVVSIPLSRYMAWIMDGKYRPLPGLRWFEARLDSGAQDWKQYTVALLVFNAVLFVYGFVVLALQPVAPLNPLGRGMLAPSTIFNTVISFMTNTNLQHYSGDQHLSNFSQIFFILPNMFLADVPRTGADGKPATVVEPVRAGSDIQSVFFEMWRQEHPDAQLAPVPGDMVTASASGLDPDITLANALFQLDRVAAAWARDTKRNAAPLRAEILALLQQQARAPLGGLAGEPMVNVLAINLELRKRYGAPSA